MKITSKRDLAMLRPLFSKVAGRSGFDQRELRRLSKTAKRNGAQMSSKLSSHSSRNAKLRPISKRKLSSFRRSQVVARRIADSVRQSQSGVAEAHRVNHGDFLTLSSSHREESFLVVH